MVNERRSEAVRRLSSILWPNRPDRDAAPHGSGGAEIRRQRVRPEPLDKRVEAQHFLPSVGAKRPKSDGALLRLALADHEQVWDPREAVLAHLVVDLLVAKVRLDTNASRGQLRRDLLRIIVGLRHDRR